MAKQPKTIDNWCLHFQKLGTNTKTKAKTHLDCTDCCVYHTGECPYFDENVSARFFLVKMFPISPKPDA